MKKDVQLLFQKLNKSHRYRMIWYRIVSALACVTVFITTYALILPAITMESASDEEIRAALYSSGKILKCPLEVHEHSEKCYDEDNNLICGYADFVVHKHVNSCYGAGGELLCQLPEIEVHSHDLNCENENSEIICGKNEIALHKHDKYCYDENGKLICGMLEVTEHIHGIDCFKMPAVSFEKEYDGLNIGLNADEGVFPVVSSPLEMKISEPSEKIINSVESKLNGTYDFKVMDIYVVSVESNVSPSENITLTFKNISTQINMNEAIVCHVDSEGNETQLEFTKNDDGTAEVSTRTLGTFVVASPALRKTALKSSPLRAPAAMTGAADAKYYTDRTGNIGVSSEGFTDATANLSLYANNHVQVNIGQHVPNSAEYVGGTLYLPIEKYSSGVNFLYYCNEQDWDGNAPFRITGFDDANNVSYGNIQVQGVFNDFRLENDDHPNNPVKFDRLYYIQCLWWCGTSDCFYNRAENFISYQCCYRKCGLGFSIRRWSS